MSEIKWLYSAFSELTTAALYDILSLRQLVFIVEQKCPYLDADGYDFAAKHLMGWHIHRLVAYARILPSGAKHHERSIGRVATHPTVRGGGIGKALMQAAIRKLLAEDSGAPIRISAQEHLADTFYAALGFQRIGHAYDEDGILHVDMMHCGPLSRDRQKPP